MRRRDFILLLGGASLFPARAAWAQATGRIYRIGIITREPNAWGQFFEELQANGFVRDRNLLVVGAFGIGGDQYGALAGELAKAGVDAIIVGGAPGTRAAQQATRSIPILSLADDLVGERFVASLAHPGGNITGISMLAPELDGKRQEILLELVPAARHLATLADPQTTPPQQLQRLEAAAGERNIEFSIHRATTRDEIVSAIAAAKAAGAQALNVLASVNFYANRPLVIETVARVGLPAMFQWPEWIEHGALAGYGPSLASMFRQMARQLVKVLNGTLPTEIPVEQPTTIELALNLKTAAALALAVPPSLLIRADKVIE